MKRLKKYLHRLAIALDQLLGTMLGGEPDMTISAAAWLWHVTGRRSWPCRLIDKIFFWEKRHCYESFLSEVRGSQTSPLVRAEALRKLYEKRSPQRNDSTATQKEQTHGQRH